MADVPVAPAVARSRSIGGRLNSVPSQSGVRRDFWGQLILAIEHLAVHYPGPRSGSGLLSEHKGGSAEVEFHFSIIFVDRSFRTFLFFVSFLPHRHF